MTLMTAKIENDEVQKYFDKLPESSFNEAKKALRQTVFAAAKEVNDNATNILNVRTGHLRRSIGTSLTGTDFKSLRASVSSGLGANKPIAYALIHELGGTIRAKKAYSKVPGGPYLNIPIADNLTPAGVQRMTPRMVFNQGGNIVKSKNGNYVVLMGSQLMFVLKKSVTIKPRLGMVKAAEKQTDLLMTRLNKLLEG